MLKKSIIESEALQSAGDDRPVDESHINELLEEDSIKIKKTPKKNKKAKAKKVLKKKKR